MNTKRKTLKMPVRYLMNLVLVGLLFVVHFSRHVWNASIFFRPGFLPSGIFLM